MTPLQRFLVQAHDFAKTPSAKNWNDTTDAMTRLQESVYGPGVSASGLPLDASGAIMHPGMHDTAVKAALAMEKDESSFAHNLGVLFLSSDGKNRAALLCAFPQVFSDFAR